MHGAGFTGSGERRLNSASHTSTSPPKAAPASSSPPPSSARAPTPSSARSPPQTLALPYDDVLVAAARHRPRPQLRPHRRQPHRHDRRQTRRARLASNSSTTPPHRTPHLPTPAHTRDRLQARRPSPTSRNHGNLDASARYEAPGNIFWDDDLYSGDAYPAYAWAVYVAEVAVDTTTYTATVTDFHALQEVGKVIHPILAKGQIEGGVAQGIGYALYEKCV